MHAYDMALRGLCGGLRASLRLGRASRVTVASVLCRTEFALTEGLTTQPALLRPACLRQSQPPGHRGFAAQAQALAEAPVPEATPSRYRIEVVTGDVRGAGTHAPAIVTLHGESGDSSDFVIGNEEENGFERGSSKMYELNIERDLGPLKRIHIEQCEPSVTETGFGWFLDKLEVTGPNGQTITFPCHSWIGKNDAGDISGPVSNQRNLIPCQRLDLPATSLNDLEQPLVVQASAIAVPHPEKVNGGAGKAVNKRKTGWGGEDAYFYTCGQHGLIGMGVADGVYQWREQGIDAGEFSRLLMHTALQAVEDGQPDVLKVMQGAAAKVAAAGTQGSSTCCIALLDTRHGRLASANIGDSGFLVLGVTPTNPKPHVKFRTPQQEHRFGCPYQLGHHAAADPPEDAMLTALPLIAGDTIVMGSDGLFDNVADETIVTEVVQLTDAGKRASIIAQKLCAVAFNNSVDKDAITPYCVAATEAFDMVYNGGKKDDITVLVARVQ